MKVTPVGKNMLVGKTAEGAIARAKELIAQDGIPREVIRDRSGWHWIVREEAYIFEHQASEWTLVWPKE